MSVEEVGHLMKAQFRRVSWREGCEGQRGSRFASCRVRLVDCVAGGADDEEIWLLMEMPLGETAPCRFWLVTLPRRTTRDQLVHLVKERYRTERAHQDLKGELGLDHFEGRTYRGWHHHVTVALVCFAFIVAERVRRGSARREPEENDHSIAGTARPPFPPALEQPATVIIPPHREMIAQTAAMPRAQ